MLVLKVVNEDMTSHDGFVWPESGPVAPEAWDDAPECGNGLHGWLNGEGNYRHSFMEGKWIVFEANEVVKLDGGGKVKTGAATVTFVGTRADAVKLLIERGALTGNSNPGWCCFSNTQLQELAYRSTNRAAKIHAVKGLRVTKQPKLEELAAKIEAQAHVFDAKSAEEMRVLCRNAADAGNAANAANAADAAYYAGNAAYYAEQEECRLDKLELLGFVVRQ